MIRLTSINRVPLVVNSDLIEHIEIAPDTAISLINGHKFVVVESADEIIRKVVSFRRQITAFPQGSLTELARQPSDSMLESANAAESAPVSGR
ncbi:MAG TPA: flagellar FlbD family protein [Bryobacteraceae bacterium]|nr:flagellar FlbD family protein [Bryobacteraceae bacterium]